MVSELIARLDRCLATTRTEYFAHLQPGVTTDQLDRFETRFNLRLPIEFRLMYEWKNGQESANYQSLYMNWIFPPLEDIASTKEMLDEMIETDFDSPDWWRREWIPFLDNGGGDRLVLDLGSLGSHQPRPLITFWHDSPKRNICYASMEVWLKDLVESMENGSLRLI